MAKGDPITSPYEHYRSGDYLGRQVVVTVVFNTNTRALTSVTVHRDAGCLYNKVILDNPSDAQKARELPLPADGEPDTVYTAQQMKTRGLDTIEQLTAIQVTASP